MQIMPLRDSLEIVKITETREEVVKMILSLENVKDIKSLMQLTFARKSL